jgi:hypothetical protein
MRGFIGKMSLAMTEERGKFVEAEKGKSPVQCREIPMASTWADIGNQALQHESSTQPHRLREAPGHGGGREASEQVKARGPRGLPVSIPLQAEGIMAA